MKAKNILTFVFGKVMNGDSWSFMRSRVLFLVLLSSVINLSCDNLDGENSRSRTDSPPVITSVKILPENPNTECELNVFAQIQTSGRAPVTYRYQWMKNDEEIIGEDKNTLKKGNFKKGDLIRIKVIPSDGKGDGKPFLSDPVKILNSPPVIQEIWIEPKVAYATDRLKASVKSSDPDGDPINYLYKWEKNGTILSEEDIGILEPNRFKKGDSITVTVTPHDGEASGKAKKSEAILIPNSPPIIVSSPPTNLKGNTYSYQVKAEDPDSDPITFTLKTGPKGMDLDKGTGLLRWEIRKGDQGEQLIEIEASDSEGAKSLQRYTLDIQFR